MPVKIDIRVNGDSQKEQKQPIPVTQLQPVRFKTGLKNTVWDVMRDRGWRETDG